MEEFDGRVRFAIEGKVGVLTLIRSAQLNAFDAAMHVALARCLDKVAANKEIGVLILTGQGRAFSSGQDLGERAATFAAGETPDLHCSLDKLYNPLVRQLVNLPIPVIAAVNGIAFGAGAAIAIACDITLAAKSARFQFGFVNVGLGPDSGASWTLPRLVGAQRAMDMALSANPVSGLDAEHIGLVARCVDDEKLLPEAMEMASQISKKSRDAVRLVKRCLRASGHISLDNALDLERDSQAQLAKSSIYRDSVLHFAAGNRK